MEERVTKLEEKVVTLEIGMVRTETYVKMILDSLTEVKSKIDCITMSDKKQFWDADTKKTIIKWVGVTILIVVALLAGKDILQLANLIPK